MSKSALDLGYNWRREEVGDDVKGRRPWIVFRRSLGVLRLVSRYATRENALRGMKRSDESAWLFGPLHVDQISPDLARALGVRS